MDFAFAKKVVSEKTLKTVCGTAHYVAPEILNTNIRYYDQRCDVWSLGVFTYVLLGGYPPFEGVLEDLAKEILSGYYEFHDEYWRDISSSAKEMISSMLCLRPEDRVSVDQALSCKWMSMEDEKLLLRDLSTTQASILRQMPPPMDKLKSAVNTVRISVLSPFLRL